MKTKNPQFKGSPVAAANFRWSLDFFRNHDVTTVGYNLIPDEVLEAWVAPSAVRRLFVRLRLSRPDLCRQAQRRFVRYTLRKGHRRFLSVSGSPALYRGNE